jgi:hypothetical protein
MRGLSAIFLLALMSAAIAPTLAGQPTSSLDLSGVPGAASPAESGKPAIGGPPTAAAGHNENPGCPPALPCGTRLLGSVRKNGAVELQVPAWRW